MSDTELGRAACCYPVKSVLTYLLTARFPTPGLSATHVRIDWLLDWSLAAKQAKLLITYLVAAYPTHRRSKHD